VADPGRQTPGELYYNDRSKSMGKRELLLIVAFVVVGAIVYQITAPAEAPGERHTSIGQIIQNIERGVQGNRARAAVTTTSTFAVAPTVDELRLALTSGEITIVGEDRADIQAELQAQSNGFDQAEAEKLARETTLTVSDSGTSKFVGVNFPVPGTQTAKLALKVPNRLRIRLNPNNGHLRITGVREVELVNARGNTEIRQVAGLVTGSQRGGELLVSAAGSVKLTALGSNVTLEEIRGDSTITTTSGELKITGIHGPFTVDSNATDVSLDKIETESGMIRLSVSSGSIKVTGLRSDGRIDARNADVTVSIARPAPLSIYSEGNDPVDVMLPAAGGYQLDAVANGGRITAPAGLPQVVATKDAEQRATGPVRGGGPMISIRSTHGDITLSVGAR
jgi:hypothetical protein